MNPAIQRMLDINRPPIKVEIIYAKCTTCKECGYEFESHNGVKYCSVDCKQAPKKRRYIQKKGIIKNLTSEQTCIKVFKMYRANANKRDYEFLLTVEFFMQHYKKPCHYCGDILNTVGFDRVENSIGYTESNVVPCCGLCNLMKHKGSVKHFLEHCQKVVKHTINL